MRHAPSDRFLRSRFGVVLFLAALATLVAACDSGTESEPTPRLLLSTDTTAYSIGDEGILTVVNQDTVVIRHRALWCAPVERLEGDDWVPLGRLFETWHEDRDDPPEPCGFLTQGYVNLDPGEEDSEVFDVLEFMAVEGTYRISITGTEEDRVFQTENLTVEEPVNGGG